MWLEPLPRTAAAVPDRLRLEASLGTVHLRRLVRQQPIQFLQRENAIRHVVALPSAPTHGMAGADAHAAANSLVRDGSRAK